MNRHFQKWVRTAKVLQSKGQAQTLRELLKAEQGKGLDFLRIANSLFALYPNGRDGKSLLDAMILALTKTYGGGVSA
jgi:putative DNA methylase